MAAFTVRLPDIEVDKLDRSRSYLAAKAIEDYLEKETWQLAEIEAGLNEANQGEFASPEEVAGVIAKYVSAASGK